MVDIKSAKCPSCIGWIDAQRANSKYDGYCTRCFKSLFPHDPRTPLIHLNTKELRVRQRIKEAAEHNAIFKGFVHNESLWTHNCDCTHRRRVDHRKLIGNTMLAVETDENGHCGYDADDEEVRYDDVYMVFAGKWVWIRFNIDGGVDDEQEQRIDRLMEEIERQVDRIERGENTELVEIVRMFY
jgi:hypothetical protein